ncbi:hypothetical protein GCM10017576_31890 [Microbacterium barkeri]|uniref:Uncharacterized protein n=1 Tax=Microbacterium barkeri TaxID=33917 RepID=A0A9W6LY98_9MICO|nr:hypothetical protein [Microbacterium barkeri]MDR6875029.1 hypothetical protein [Microbacterium barkeri]GLJ63058.1 hypothetical protein GCM10017576_31890 [Microbacterium barkeri]
MSAQVKGASDDDETVGMRVVFWSWFSIVAVGLAVMIILPLTGR